MWLIQNCFKFEETLSDDIYLCWAKASSDWSLDEAVEDHVDELADLTDVAPDLGLDRRVHLHLLNRQGDQLVKNVRNLTKI